MIELAGYEYLHPLGTPGHFGQVFKARNLLSNQVVAIKHIEQELSEEAVLAWLHEARAMAACEHENVVQILHSEVTADGPALVMEFVPGGSVSDRYGTAPASVSDVVQIGIDTCWGLHHLHGRGLTHRDIKPANLLIGHEGVKLGDFGLAGSEFRQLDLVYTPHLPPELHGGDGLWTHCSDIYTLGATLWRLIWGDENVGRNDRACQELIEGPDWPDANSWPIHVHKQLRTVLRSSLSPDPQKRPQSASDFRSKLEAAAPKVGWVPAGDHRWVGTGAAQWSVQIVPTNVGANVETKRDNGRGARRVSDGCSKWSSLDQARDAAGGVLQNLAAIGSI